MTRSKHLLCYLLLLPLSAALLVICNLFFQACTLFGSSLFTATDYKDTWACANAYRNYMDAYLSGGANPDNYPYTLVEHANAPTETVYYNYPSPANDFEFVLTFYLEDQTVTFTNCSSAEQALEFQLAPNHLYYLYNINADATSVNSNMLYLNAQHAPSLDIYYMTEPLAGLDHPENLPYTLKTRLANPTDGWAYGVNMPQEEQLFQFFSGRWVPMGFLSLLCIVGLVLLLRRLGRKEGALLAQGKRGILFLWSPLFYVEGELALSAAGLASVVLLILQKLDTPSFLRSPFALGGWLVFLLFLLRFVLSRAHWRQTGALPQHLFLWQLAAHWRPLLPSMVCLGLLAYLNLANPQPLQGFPQVKVLLNLLLMLYLLANLLAAFSLIDKVRAIARQGDTAPTIPLPRPFNTIDGELETVRQELLQAAQQQALAIQQQMEHERLKAELVTNVSHDLKTPLTSVINYVALLQKELPPDGPYREHLQVLQEKSLQLKSLTDDLLELSRLNAGAEKPQLEIRDFGEIVRQANGEYAEALEIHQLELRSDLPTEPVQVPMDGGKLWRVLQNLYGNVVKYALEGTRVYVALAREEQEAHFYIRNISRQALNLPPQELMERFVRGDRSRHTQGNGLGLSIAQTLMELQNGRFQLDIQGDLFTAHLYLPLAQELQPDQAAEEPHPSL